MDFKPGDVVVIKTEKELVESGHFERQVDGYMRSRTPDNPAGVNKKMFIFSGKRLVIKEIKEEHVFFKNALDYETLVNSWSCSIYMLKKETRQLDIDFGD